MTEQLCIWNCGQKTKNRSRICNDCWAALEKTRSMSKEGYQAWLEKKRAKAARLPDPRRVEAGKRSAAKRALVQQEMPQSGGGQPQAKG